MEPRSLRPRSGWRWIAHGYALFRRSPAVWLAIVLLLFFASELFLGLPALGVVFLLLMPVFVAGLMEGCRSLERGEPLLPSHLIMGFRHNAAQLVTIGGVWLVGNIAILMMVREFGGDAIVTLQKLVPKGTVPSEITPEMQAAARTVMRTSLMAMLASVPLLMLVLFAPLLVYFHDVRPLAAMKASFVACVRNVLPLLVYSAAVFGGIVIATPLSLAFGRPDLPLWLLAPVVLPSIYASYRDIFTPDTAITAHDSVAS